MYVIFGGDASLYIDNLIQSQSGIMGQAALLKPLCRSGARTVLMTRTSGVGALTGNQTRKPVPPLLGQAQVKEDLHIGTSLREVASQCYLILRKGVNL